MSKKNKKIIKGIINVVITVAVLAFFLYFSKKETATDWVAYVICGLWFAYLLIIYLADIVGFFKNVIGVITGRVGSEDDLDEINPDEEFLEEKLESKNKKSKK